MFIPLFLAAVSVLPSSPEPLLMLRQPSISSDARRIAFTANGDLYLGSATGGEAARVVDDPVNARHPRFAPSGDQIAFTSLRSGNGDIYLVNLETLTQRRLTFHSSEDVVESWSPDGAFVYFSSSRADISGYTDLYAVAVQGGTPFPVSRARFEGEYNASVSPDGSRLAFNTNDRVRQWWRLGPRTDDATEVWIKPTDPSSNSFEKVTTFEGKDSWPMWSPDGNGVFVVTDEYPGNGTENIAYQGLEGERRPITSFEKGRVSWPTIATDGTIAFERDFAIWTVRDGEAPRTIEFALATEDVDREPMRTETLSDVSEFHVGVGDADAVVVIHGDIFLTTLDTGKLRRVTETPEPEQEARLSPDGTRVAYVALRDGYFDVFVYDSRELRETRITSTPATERNLRFSPDGRRLAFAEGVDRIKVVDLENKGDTTVASGLMIDPEFAWSPDGRLIAYVASDPNWLSNVWLTEVDAPQRRVRLTDFPNVYFHGLSWTPDMRSLFLSTWMTRETRQVAKVEIPRWVSDRGTENWSDAELGAVEYILPPNESLILDAVSPDGTLAVLSGTSLGQRGLWQAAIGEGNLHDFSLVAPRPVSDAVILDDRSVIYLSGGSLYRSPADGGEATKIELEAAFEFDPAPHRLALFREAWLVLRDWLSGGAIDEQGLDTLYERYAPVVRGVRNDFDFMTVIHMMLGELNVSHVNVRGDPKVEAEPVGDLGVDFDPAALRAGRLVVLSIVSSAAEQRGQLMAGDEIDSIAGAKLGVHVNLHEHLTGRAGETVSARVARDGKLIDAVLTPRSTGDVAEARYRAWVANNERLVNRLSGGRFSYVHRRHFGSGATEELRRQLGASALQKAGVVLDVRYNGGGIESTRAIGYLRSRIVHFNAFKDKVVAPSALVHGNPVLDRPVVLVQNEQVLSDTENLSEQFRALGVGPVVGTRTAGWNRGQRRYSLFDGTRAGVGAWRALTSDGEEMDRRGRDPDVFVDRSLGETLEGVDSQLEAAVAALDTWIRDREPQGLR